MLIVTRLIGERLLIGDDITVTVVDINGSQVRLATQAPPQVAVHREEIYQRIQAGIPVSAPGPAPKPPCVLFRRRRVPR